jgi:NAD(P)-dependent dehydrogenase (short-subunit alcohol dehydrogenase family)
MEIKDKFFLITGGARRVGKEISLFIAEQGGNLFIHYFSSENQALELKKDCENRGVKVELIKADMTQIEGLNSLLDYAKRSDAIICNASSFEKILIENLTLEEIEKSMRINFLFHFLLIKAMWESLKEKGKTGKAIFILDVERARRNFIPYHLGKELGRYLVEHLFKFFAPEVLINGVALGPILPPEGENEEYLKKVAQKTATKKYGAIDEVISAIKFLLENDTVAGSIIQVCP